MITNTNRRNVFILFVITLLLGFVGYVISHPQIFGLEGVLCDWYKAGGSLHCGEKYNLSIGVPLFAGMKYISIPFLVMSFVPQTYSSWKKFGYWALPLMLVLTWLMPPMQGGFINYLPNRSGMAALLSKWYMTISLLTIAYSWWQQRSSDTGKE